MANWTTTGYELFNATALPATAEFTIVPNAGYSISASQFDYNETIDYIVDIIFSDNGNAGTPTNTVKGTIQFVGSDDYTFNADIQESITLSVIEVEQINSITLSTAVLVQSYGNNALVSGADVNITTNSLYTGYQATLNDPFNWNVETGNNGTTFAAFPNVSIPLNSHVNFMEILITPNQGHYFADSPNEDANSIEVFGLEDSSLTLNLPGFGNGNQSYQAEEYLNEQAWEISREIIMSPVNGDTQSTSNPVMVCTGIKFTINYFSPATQILLDLNNNNAYDEEFIINISIPGVVPRVLKFLDPGPLNFSYTQLSNFQIPIKNTVNSYTISQTAGVLGVLNPLPEAFANFVSINLQENITEVVQAMELTITADQGAVDNSPGVTVDSIELIQSDTATISVKTKLASEPIEEYSGVELLIIPPFQTTISALITTNTPFNNEFNVAETLLNPQYLATGAMDDATTVFANSFFESENIITEAEEQEIIAQIQAGYDAAIANQANTTSSVQVQIIVPANPSTTFYRHFVIQFSHPLDSSITASLTFRQKPAYSPSVNTLEFFAATNYDNNGIPTSFEALNDAMPIAKTDNNYIQNDGGIVKIYAKIPNEEVANIDINLQNMFVLQNLSQVNPPDVNDNTLTGNNYFLSTNEEGYQHFTNLQAEFFVYNPDTMTGGPVNVEITFNAPQNDYYFSIAPFYFNNLFSEVGLSAVQPAPAELQILGYNPLNPYFDINSTDSNPPDDIALFKQAQLDTVVVSGGGGAPDGSLAQITNNLDVDYFDSETGQVKVEILQYKDIQVDEETGDLSLTDWKTTAIDGPPAWCGFDENFTTSSVTSPVSSEAFNLTNFSVTLHHQVSSSIIGRSVKLGYSTLSAVVDSNNINTFNQPFAKVKELNFTTPPDIVTLSSFFFVDNSLANVSTFNAPQEFLYNEIVTTISNTNNEGEFYIGHSNPEAQLTSIVGDNHKGIWDIYLLDSFNSQNNLEGGLVGNSSGFQSFTFNFNLSNLGEAGFKLHKLIITYSGTLTDAEEVILEQQDFVGSISNPDGLGADCIDFITTTMTEFNNQLVGQVTLFINAEKLHAAKQNAPFSSLGDGNRLNQTVYLLVSRLDYDGVGIPGPYPHATELVKIHFGEFFQPYYTSIDPSLL